MYLRGCRNAIAEIAYLEELDLSSNLQSLVAKLPFKLRERWRTEAYKLQERRHSRVKFSDLVKFIETQVKILTDPVFGNIRDATVNPGSTTAKKPTALKSQKPKVTGSNFATSVACVPQPQDGNPQATPQLTKEQVCLFCSNEHMMETCPQLKRKMHKEKIGFLKEKGICFGCLKPGHMSKDCNRRLSCKVCNQTHPTVLHIGKVDKEKVTLDKEKGTVLGTAEDSMSHGVKFSVCGRIGDGGHIGASEEECALAIMPVKVKSNNGNKIIHTYAFLDPGSMATFCTDTHAPVEYQSKRDQHSAPHHGSREDSKQSYCPRSGGE